MSLHQPTWFTFRDYAHSLESETCLDDRDRPPTAVGVRRVVGRRTGLTRRRVTLTQCPWEMGKVVAVLPSARARFEVTHPARRQVCDAQRETGRREEEEEEAVPTNTGTSKLFEPSAKK